jgi:hypothetical protein
MAQPLAENAARSACAFVSGAPPHHDATVRRAAVLLRELGNQHAAGTFVVHTFCVRSRRMMRQDACDGAAMAPTDPARRFSAAKKNFA